MLRTDLPDHRRATEAELLEALRRREPLALAEAYHRTVPAAHAVARRLLSGSGDVEALLRALYSELWQAPPDTASLERWARERTWALGSAELGERGVAPASPSASALLPDLPKPDVRYLDAAERALADLDAADREALLLAHDQGVPTSAQGRDAAAAVERALLALAGPETSATDTSARADDPCTDLKGLGDLVLGLADAEVARDLEAAAASRPGCAALLRALRRGRRRLEGLPATPDAGQRVLVMVLTSNGAAAPAVTAAPAELFVAEAEDEPHTDELFRDVGARPAAAPASALDADDFGPDTSPFAPAVEAPAAPSEPAPQSTGELRLSEILAAGDEPATSPAMRPSPYTELTDLEGEARAGEPGSAFGQAGYAEVYVEGEDEYPEDELRPARGGGGLLRLLAWVVPILAGGAVGLFVAILLFR